MPRTTRLLSFCTGLLVVSVLGQAGAQVLPMTLPDLVADASRIVRGEFVDQRVERIRSRNGEHIRTLMTFRVDRTLKGEPRSQLLLEFSGGTIGDETLDVSGLETFEVGDRAVLFLHDRVGEFSPLVGWSEGHLGIETSNTDDVVVLNDGTVLADIDQIGRIGPSVSATAPRPPISVQELERVIQRAVQLQSASQR